ALDLFVAEAVEAAVRDELERRAGVVTHHFTQREHLVEVGGARWSGLTVAVAVRVRLRRRESQAAGLDRRREQRGHLVELLGRGPPADRFLAHHDAPDRTVTDEKARVHAEVALEPREVVGERSPLPV